MALQQIKLEVGKKYKNRKGQVATIDDKLEGYKRFPFMGTIKGYISTLFSEKGYYYDPTGEIEHDYDLIEEVKE